MEWVYYLYKTKPKGDVDVNRYIQEFEEELNRQGMSINTTDSYVRDVKGFVKWFEGTYGEEFAGEIISKEVDSYKSYLNTVKKQKVTTINRKLNSIAKFNKYLAANGYSKKDLDVRFFSINSTERDIRILDKNEYRKLERTFYKLNNKRDILVFELLAKTGARVSEIISIELDDIQLTERNGKNNYSSLIIRETKNGEVREIPMNPELKKAILEYLEVRPIDDNKLLQGQRGSLTRSAVFRIIKKYCDKANVTQISPHDLRHYFATTLIKDKNVDIATVKSLTGHKTTKVLMDYYVNNTMEDKIKALEGL